EDADSFLNRLRREKSFLERVFNALQEGVIVTAPDLRVLAVNDRALDLLGLSPERRKRALGHPLMEIVEHKALRSLILRLDPEAPRTAEEEVEIDRPGAPKGSARLALRVNFAPLSGGRDTMGGLVIILA